jgi:hypothetical protein
MNVFHECTDCVFFSLSLPRLTLSFSHDMKKSVGVAIIQSRFDCANSLLSIIFNAYKQKLQRLQNNLACNVADYSPVSSRRL